MRTARILSLLNSSERLSAKTDIKTLKEKIIIIIIIIIVQEIEICPYEQMMYAQTRICPGE